MGVTEDALCVYNREYNTNISTNEKHSYKLYIYIYFFLTLEVLAV